MSSKKGSGVHHRIARDVHEAGRELLHYRGSQGSHDVLFFLLFFSLYFFFFFCSSLFFSDGWHMAFRRLPRRRGLIQGFSRSSRPSIVLSLVVAWAQVPSTFTIHAISPHVSTGGALEHVGPTQKRRPTRCAVSNVVTHGFLQIVIHEASLTDRPVLWPPYAPTPGALPAGSAEELWRMYKVRARLREGYEFCFG